jgi:hypothetical protein
MKKTILGLAGGSLVYLGFKTVQYFYEERPIDKNCGTFQDLFVPLDTGINLRQINVGKYSDQSLP